MPIDEDKKQNPKRKDNSKDKKDIRKRIIKDVLIAIAVMFILMLPAIIYFTSTAHGKEFMDTVFKKREPYTYAQFISDLANDKIAVISTKSGHTSANIILKSQKDIDKENEIRKEYEGVDFEKEPAKKAEMIQKLRSYIADEYSAKNLKEFSFFYPIMKEQRDKFLEIPTISSFTDLVQTSIENGSDVQFSVKAVTDYAAMFQRLIMLAFLLILVAMLFTTTGVWGKIGKRYDASDEAKSADDNKTRFKDVAGLDEEKAQLVEIVDFLKHPKKYERMGAKIPKGVLLYGPPGTGKTLIAKAIAGEAQVPFFGLSGSDFIEMFAGLGAQRVRKLFKEASKVAPSIIFIDEIDAIGSRRQNSMSGADSENNQTLNQLLVEMDGFNTDKRVIVIAATNRLEMLDKALLRPGRFDRQIVIPAPDLKGRIEILKLHAKGKRLSRKIDLKDIAAQTAGFTGAELANMINEAAILAANKSRKSISKEDIEEAFRKVAIGLEKQNKIINHKERRITAYHEAGHAIVSHFLQTQDDVKEITIIPRGMAGGYTMYKKKEDKAYTSKREFEEEIVALMGGRAAEHLIIKDVTSGASNDIQRATTIARNMIIFYGMSETLGPISLNVEDPYELNFFGTDITKYVGKEIRAMVETAYLQAIDLLEQNMDILHAVAKTLLSKERIDDKEFVEVVNQTLAKRQEKLENAAQKIRTKYEGKTLKQVKLTQKEMTSTNSNTNAKGNNVRKNTRANNTKGN